MSEPPPNSSGCPGAALWTALLCGLIVLPALAAPPGEPPGQACSYDRPDVETVRAEVQDVLADQRFVRRKSFWQWLKEQLGKWRWPFPRVGEGMGTFLAWAVIVWCVLALLAILGHVVWTIATLVRTRPGRAGLGVGPGRLRPGSGLSHDDLLREAARLAAQGAWRRAIGLTMAALLQWLDQVGVVRFHESKTNGEYVREYSAAFTGREEFCRLTSAFDTTLYGSAPCSRTSYEALCAAAARVRNNVRKRHQV